MKEKREAEEAAAKELDAEAIGAAEENAEEELRKAEEKLKAAKSDEEKEKAEALKQAAAAEALKNKEKRLRIQLDVAVKLRKRPKLIVSIDEAKESKIEALKPDIGKAEKVSDSLKCGEDLEDAMGQRNMEGIEEALSAIKKKGFEKDHVVQMLEADKLVEKLKRLEKAKKEILELNQRTIAEIRSYQKPKKEVRDVMILTYMILAGDYAAHKEGYKEKDLQEWKTIQALLGKTGKISLKRMCTTKEASTIDLKVAKAAEKKYLINNNYSLASILENSAGVATFYAWATTMIEEKQNWDESSEFRKAIEDKRKLEEEEMKKLQKGRKKK